MTLPQTLLDTIATLRGVHTACPLCHGLGAIRFSAGAVATSVDKKDISASHGQCPTCNGSGDRNRPWPHNWKEGRKNVIQQSSFIDQDRQGRWFVVPVQKRTLWRTFLDQRSDLKDPPKWAIPTDGHPSFLRFENVRGLKLSERQEEEV